METSQLFTSSTNTNNTSNGNLTTQNFSKDSISIRIKAKYQSVDILPLYCYQRFIDYIRKNYLSLVLTLEPHLNVRLKDDLANSLVRIAHKLQIQTKFLSDLVLELEVLNSDDNNLTFRGNSLATKAMESYMKLVGESYLKQTLSDCVRSIIDTSHDLEIDPSKVANQSSLNANREELVQILHLVCGRVFNSCVNFPVEMKHVFARLRNECRANGKTDEMCDTLISASIFLRFICPAILSPNLFNLTQEYPQEKAARKLTLAAKTLQTIANFSKFGGKEFYMSFDKMNLFVNEHTILMREFLRKISTISDEDVLLAEQSTDNSMMPIVSLTPLTPKTSPTMQDTNFDLEFIDLGKQLSILHGLLTSICASLDETVKLKCGAELNEVLGEIAQLKKSSIVVNQAASVSGGKAYSYDNRLHYALMKNQVIQQQQFGSPLTPSTPSATTPTSVNSSNEFIQQQSSSLTASMSVPHSLNENAGNKTLIAANGVCVILRKFVIL